MKYNQFSLPESLIEDFTFSDCWALALRLHEATGWDLIAVGIEGEEECMLRGWLHMGVRMPNGEVLDVMGAHHEGDWLDHWQELHQEDTDSFIVDDTRYYDLLVQNTSADAHATAQHILSALALETV